MSNNLVIEKFIFSLNKYLYPRRLNTIQEKVLRSAYEGKTYTEIAADSGYNYGYIKTIGYDLWNTLSKYLQTKVKKSNVEVVIEEYAKIKQKNYLELKID